MGPQVRRELGKLRLEDLLREAGERSTPAIRRSTPRRPAPRSPEER